MEEIALGVLPRAGDVENESEESDQSETQSELELNALSEFVEPAGSSACPSTILQAPDQFGEVEFSLDNLNSRMDAQFAHQATTAHLLHPNVSSSNAHTNFDDDLEVNLDLEPAFQTVSSKARRPEFDGEDMRNTSAERRSSIHILRAND
jgi:hypothetical protein